MAAATFQTFGGFSGSPTFSQDVAPRWDKGDANVRDIANAASLAAYNNEYNYWLWQQQADYNSPTNQVARLKAAGLNPNYNSIDGTGNLQSLPSSSARYSSGDNGGVSKLQSLMTGVSLVESLIKSVGGSVNALSDYAAIPKTESIKDTRKLYGQVLKGTAAGKYVDQLLKSIQLQSEEDITGYGVGGYIGRNFSISQSGNPNFRYEAARERVNNLIQQQTKLSYEMDLIEKRGKMQDLLNAAQSYHNDKLQPLERERALLTLDKIAADAGISAQTLDFMKTKQGLYTLGILANSISTLKP